MRFDGSTISVTPADGLRRLILEEDCVVSENDSENMEDIDRQIHIDNLKEQADALTGGEMSAHTSDDCPPEVEEQFWENVVEYEMAPQVSPFERLVEAGVELPEADALDDAALSKKLWEIIEWLGKEHVFLSSTDHLSERELYALLWQDLLRELSPVLGGGWNWHLDVLGSGNEEDTYLSMKYYADEESRKQWMESFPDYEMPAHEDPPYDRDRHLPKPEYG